jgi:antitoxin component YwqK of YwqJK toxin-antitoxin module
VNRRILFFFILLFAGKGCLILAQSDTLFNQVDTKGMKQGYWKKYYPGGNLMYQGFFRDGKPAGELRRYYESGALKVVMVFTGNDDRCRSVHYYENGKPAARGNYVGTVKDSTWEYFSFYDQSVRSRETYRAGKKDGFAFHYYPDGTASERTEWKDDMKNGSWERYYANKSVMTKGVYREDKLNGPFYVFSEEGRLSVQGSFQDNLRNDRWVFYKKDGSVDVEVIYSNGKPVGEEKMTEKQKEMLKMIEENQGKYAEPDESEFLHKGNP